MHIVKKSQPAGAVHGQAWTKTGQAVQDRVAPLVSLNVAQGSMFATVRDFIPVAEPET